MDQPLLQYPPIAAVDESEFQTKNIFKKIGYGAVSFGLRAAVVSLHSAGNGLIMSSLGHNEAAASSLCATAQGLIIGINGTSLRNSSDLNCMI